MVHGSSSSTHKGRKPKKFDGCFIQSYAWPSKALHIRIIEIKLRGNDRRGYEGAWGERPR